MTKYQDRTPGWMGDARRFGAGAGFGWPAGGGLPPGEIEQRVARMFAGFRAVEAIATTTDVLLRLARHEAGHAVVARAMGLPIDEVRVDASTGGVCRFRADEAPEPWSPECDAAILAAGRLAERMFGEDGDAEVEDCGDDEAAFRELQERHDDLAAAAAIRNAEAILFEAAEEVTLLVDALVRRRRLGGDDVEELLKEYPIRMLDVRGYPELADTCGEVDDAAGADTRSGFVARMEARIRSGVAGRAPLLADVSGADLTYMVEGATRAAAVSGSRRTLVRDVPFRQV